MAKFGFHCQKLWIRKDFTIEKWKIRIFNLSSYPCKTLPKLNIFILYPKEHKCNICGKKDNLYIFLTFKNITNILNKKEKFYCLNCFFNNPIMNYEIYKNLNDTEKVILDSFLKYFQRKNG